MAVGLYMGILFSEWTAVNYLLALLPQNRIEESKNILILGLDSVQGVSRSDTIMVVNLSKTKHRVGVLSIPRDTYVDLGIHGKTKINHAYVYGGVALSKVAVEKLLKVPIDYFIVLEMSGVRHMITQMGGVDIDVKDRMYYVDRAGDLYIDFKAGRHHLDGGQAVSYLRYRHDVGGDIGRAKRQQDFIKAVAQKMLSPLQVIRLPQIIHDLRGFVQTDLTASQIFVLAMELREAFKSEKIQVNTLPGSEKMLGGVFYWNPNPEDMTAMVYRTLHGLSTMNIDLAPASQVAPQQEVSSSEILAEEPKKVETEKRSHERADREREEKREREGIQKVEAEHKAQERLARSERETLAREKVIKLEQEKREKEALQKAETERKEREKLASQRTLIFPATSTVSVEVLNGNGVDGIASKVASQLQSRGVNVPKTGEAAHHNYQNTMVVDWKGNEADALRLAKALHISPANIITYYLPQKTLGITLVVGKDWNSLGKQH